MLNKELLCINPTPFIEFQGITFELKAFWADYTGTWPENNSWIKPDPPIFIVDNIEYTITGIYIDNANSYIEISPSAKTNFVICMQNREYNQDMYCYFAFIAGATKSSFIRGNQFFLPMSTMNASLKWEILRVPYS